jgi:ADP-heptose:LPS heptosyltransferase
MLGATCPVVVYSDGIGDTIMSLPTLRVLSKLFGHRLTLIGSQISIDILKAEEIGSTFVERPQDPRDLVDAVANCDLLITADPDVEAEFSRCVREIFKPRWSSGWSQHHDIILPFAPFLNFVDETFKMAMLFDSSALIEEYSAPPQFACNELDFADSIGREIGEEFRILGVHYDTSLPKAWPRQIWIRYLEEFLSKNEDFIALAVGAQNLELDKGRFRDRIVSCHGLPLAKSMALVALAELFVGVDSGMLHVADFFRVPSVGIFGPTDPRRWGCRFTRHRHVVAPSKNLRYLKHQEAIFATESLLSSADKG